MPSYKLHYFDVRGSAEVARLLFKVADVDFEDIRYSREAWPDKKSGTSPDLTILFYSVLTLNISHVH